MEEEICEGIRGAVELFNSWGFETTDSGDGSHLKEGMKCGWDVPMVVIVEDIDELIDSADELNLLLRVNNVNDFQIEASYSPNDGIASIVIYGEGLRNLDLGDARP